MYSLIGMVLVVPPSPQQRTGRAVEVSGGVLYPPHVLG